ncbi:hypothetical protein NQZ68_022300 [Dissostichus eleginoides]|nr:hypothetical protein NQZ68_022300 [Dissostichus eleginoides]
MRSLPAACPPGADRGPPGPRQRRDPGGGSRDAQPEYPHLLLHLFLYSSPCSLLFSASPDHASEPLPPSPSFSISVANGT